MLFIVVIPRLFLLAPLLVVVGVTCLGSSFVILNSFLPLLVANHPQVDERDHHPELKGMFSPKRAPSFDSNDGISESTAFEGTPDAGNNAKDSAALKLSTQISSKGVGIGYAAAVFVQILCILVLFGMSKLSVSSTLPLRLVLLLVGTWWLCFTVPSSMWLRDRPGPPLKTISTGSLWRSCFAYTTFAWASVWRTIKVAVQLRQMVIFLVAWFLLSDSIATVSGTAILFARTELKMETVAIALLSITSISSGIAGATVWPLISRRFELSTNRTIVACILAMEIIPLYGLLGYIPFVRSWGVGGLQQAWEIYPLVCHSSPQATRSLLTIFCRDSSVSCWRTNPCLLTSDKPRHHLETFLAFFSSNPYQTSTC